MNQIQCFMDQNLSWLIANRNNSKVRCSALLNSVIAFFYLPGEFGSRLPPPPPPQLICPYYWNCHLFLLSFQLKDRKCQFSKREASLLPFSQPIPTKFQRDFVEFVIFMKTSINYIQLYSINDYAKMADQGRSDFCVIFTMSFCT